MQNIEGLYKHRETIPTFYILIFTLYIFTMPRRSFDERNIRVLFRFAKRSFALTLPIEILRDLGWRERQRIRIRKMGKRIIIEQEDRE